MRLLYITNGINGTGGLERVLSVKASLLAEQFHYEVAILCLNEEIRNPFFEFSSKVKTIPVSAAGNPIRYFLAYKKGIQKAVEDFQPSIIAVCDDGLKGFFLPRLIRTKAKWIYERHASIRFNKSKSFKDTLLKKIMLSQVSRFSQFVVLTKQNKSDWKHSNVVVIPNPLSFKSQEKSPLNQKRVIAVGSHSRNKGYDLLLEAWQQTEVAFPDWELCIFGKIDAEKTFISIAQKKELKNVRFFERVKNIQQAYLNASVLVLPSRTEGFGMVLIEAMECGVPCVAFDCPSGPADIIRDGEDGFLVQAEDVKALTQKLSFLMGNEAARKQLGTKAKENVARYAPEKIVQQWDELFVSLQVTRNL